MTATLQTTITELLGSTLEEVNQPDPAAYERAADAVLAPYGCTLLGNGDIIRTDLDADALEWDAETVREGLATIDTTD